MVKLREYTQEKLEGSTAEEAWGRKIKSVVEWLFSFSGTVPWMIGLIVLIHLFDPREALRITIGPLQIEGTDLSQIAVIVFVSFIWMRWEYRNLHCEYPG